MDPEALLLLAEAFACSTRCFDQRSRQYLREPVEVGHILRPDIELTPPRKTLRPSATRCKKARLCGRAAKLKDALTAWLAALDGPLRRRQAAPVRARALERRDPARVPERFEDRGLQAKARADRGPRRGRSEERRVGKECRSRWSPYH